MQIDIQIEELTDEADSRIFRNFADVPECNTCYIQIIRTLKDMLRPLVKMGTEGVNWRGIKAWRRRRRRRRRKRRRWRRRGRHNRSAVCEKMFFFNIVFIRFSGRGNIGRVCHQKVTESRLDYKPSRLEVFIVFFGPSKGALIATVFLPWP